jgi:hypothetical protein
MTKKDAKLLGLDGAVLPIYSYSKKEVFLIPITSGLREYLLEHSMILRPIKQPNPVPMEYVNQFGARKLRSKK